MRKLFFILLLLLSKSLYCVSMPADSFDTRWKYYPSFHNATQTLAVGDVVYTLFNGNLLVYNTEDQSVYTIDRLNYSLSDNRISQIAWSDTQHCLVVLYDNNNIDLVYFHDNDFSITATDVFNIPQVKNYTEVQVKANNLNARGDWACISTTEGIVLIDIKRQNIRGYYQLGTNVDDAIVIEQHLYASFNNCIMSGALSDNLYDLSQWKTAMSSIYVSRFVGCNIGAYIIVPYRATLSEEQKQHVGTARMVINTDHTVKANFICGWPVTENGTGNGKWVQFANNDVILTVNTERPDQRECLLTNTGFYPNSLSRTSNGTFFFAQGYDGLKSFKLSSDNALTPITTVGNFGPRHPQSYGLLIDNGRLFVTGGELDDYGKEGFVGYYDGTQWSDMDEDNARTLPSTDGTIGRVFFNLNNVAVDPFDSNHIMVASYGKGLYEYKKDKFVKLYNADNSPLQYPKGVDSAERNNYVRLGGCTYDKEGNLWMTANYNDTLLTVYCKDGTWKRVHFAALDEYTRAEKIMFDTKGRLWCNIRISADGKSSGLAGLDYNETISSVRDDKSNLRTSAINEDGTSCSLEGLKTMVEDQNGQIWIGCSSGIYAITDPDAWFTSNFTLYQPKVPRNDGTNYADYLLTGTDVSAIAVDAGNRKWVGTIGAGIYLVSEDGSEVLQHFTSTDSPLLSDNVYDLTIDPEKGVMYIATDAGLCSYDTNVTSARLTLEKSNIRVYPNPVRVDYKGMVSVTGLTNNAEVKLLTTGGQLVARGRSIGGTWQWGINQTLSGERVAPGIYYVVVSTEDGKQSVAAKVAVN